MTGLDLRGCTVVVTGANSGIGLRLSESVARLGGRVLMACRSEERASVALEAVRRVAVDAEPSWVRLDLGHLASVRGAAEEVHATTERLDALVNNAGVMALPFGRTADGFETHIGVNHFGHFALTGLLLPLLLETPRARVVTVSSLGHRVGRLRLDDLGWWRRPYKRFPAYTQSKLANVAFMLELGIRADRAGHELRSVGAHPGYTNTHLQATWHDDSRAARHVMSVANRIAQADTKGVLPSLYATTVPDVMSGDYFGPQTMELWGAPRPARVSPRARNVVSRAALWELSEQLTGVRYQWS